VEVNQKDLEQIAEIIAGAIRSVSHGGVSGPEGLEMVAMALSGEGPRQPLGTALADVAHGLCAIADSIDRLTEAIIEKKGATS